MRRHLEAIELDGGSWLRLECGHHAPAEGHADGSAECVLCDRAQLPPGLVAEGATRRHRAPWPKRRSYELAAAGWAIVTVEAGTLTMTGHVLPRRTLTAPARVVLVAGTRYQLAPSPDAAITIQHLRHPSRPSARPETVEGHR